MAAPELQGLAHFSIPVSDVAASRKFYENIVGCKHLFSTPPGKMSFLDAGGMCIILCQHDTPINPKLDDHNGVHHSFMLKTEDFDAALENLRANDVEIFFEEDRQGGIVNGPRCYFRDPDGTVLEYINLTSYSGAET
jgi:catechol 2,3-dioxygenase-like lactoylglutathione lyase family enzyme